MPLLQKCKLPRGRQVPGGLDLWEAILQVPLLQKGRSGHLNLLLCAHVLSSISKKGTFYGIQDHFLSWSSDFWRLEVCGAWCTVYPAVTEVLGQTQNWNHSCSNELKLAQYNFDILIYLSYSIVSPQVLRAIWMVLSLENFSSLFPSLCHLLEWLFPAILCSYLLHLQNSKASCLSHHIASCFCRKSLLCPIVKACLCIQAPPV